MKYLLTLVLFCAGCTSYPNGEPTKIRNVKVYTIDNHEYIGKLCSYNSDWATHYPDCKFCKNDKTISNNPPQ